MLEECYVKILYSNSDIQSKISELARRISTDYAGRELEIVCLLNGASMFGVDLVRALTVPARLCHFGFSSYSGAPKSGEVKVTLDVDQPLEGKDVLLVEGVVVSGRTPAYLMNLLGLRKPASLELCALGIKTEALAVDLAIRYSGFELGREFVTGYGIGSGQERFHPHLYTQTTA